MISQRTRAIIGAGRPAAQHAQRRGAGAPEGSLILFWYPFRCQCPYCRWPQAPAPRRLAQFYRRRSFIYRKHPKATVVYIGDGTKRPGPGPHMRRGHRLSACAVKTTCAAPQLLAFRRCSSAGCLYRRGAVQAAASLGRFASQSAHPFMNNTESEGLDWAHESLTISRRA